MLYGTLGEKEKSGRPFADEARNRLRGVVAVPEMPEKSAVGRVGLEKVDPEMVLNLLGLSPGITLIEAPAGLMPFTLDEATEEKFVFLGVPKSLALTDCDSLLDGPCGRPIILRDDNCEAVARFAGDSGDALRPTRGREGVLLASTFRKISSRGFESIGT